MAEIKLKQIMEKYDIGLLRLVKFLNEIKVIVTVTDPNYVISDVYMPIIEKRFRFGSESITDRDRVNARLHAIIEMGNKQKAIVDDDKLTSPNISQRYQQVGPTILGVTKVVTDDGNILFINKNNEPINITQVEFNEIWEETIKETELKNHSTHTQLRRRIYTIHFTEWNGLQKTYRTSASSKHEAEENFWNSGVKSGSFINSID